ncbi:MAG: Lrp/AsnC family transcriptional regulator [Gammaproteobacteria bacterium]|nr:MAG: Lrp/AsnC family transcriptional regulator [Gammaproteobacteria bacterium]
MDLKVTRLRSENPRDTALIAAIQEGLPLDPRPWAVIGERLGMSEAEVMARVRRMQERDLIKRLGVVVRHRRLGYRANAMVVWDIPDEQVAEIGRCFGRFDFVTLCYRRPRRLPEWRYNLFTMIHGRDREQVMDRVSWLAAACGLEDVPHEVLFSRRSFKQCGAHYRFIDLPRPADRVKAGGGA